VKYNSLPVSTVAALAPPESTEYKKLDPLIEELREQTKNWPNHAIVRQNLQCFLPEFPRQQDEYWIAMSKLNKIFAAQGVQFKTIKSIRSYHYVDSNIDIIVEKRQWRALSDAVCEQHWRKPQFKEFLEQTLIEPFKLKYKAINSDLAAAHFYAGVRWRYLAPFTFDGLDQALLWRRLPDAYDELAQVKDNLNILVPTKEFDMVIQAAHVTTENYRMTIGEVIHIRDTLAGSDFDYAKMERISQALGLSYCTKAVCKIATGYFEDKSGEAYPQKPMPLRFTLVFHSHLQYGLKTGPVGLVRAMFSLTWFPVMKIGRKLLGR